MKILYLNRHLNIGGITSYLLTLSAGLKSRGHNIYIASSGGSLAERFTEAGAEHLFLPLATKSEASPRVLISLFKLLRYVREKDIDIVHANTRVTQVLAELLYRFSGRPYVAACHGFFKKRLSRLIFPCWGRKAIAISQQVKDHLVNDFHLSREKVVVVHNGVDVKKFKIQNSKFQIQQRKKLNLGPGPVMGIVARLSDVKGHKYLIQAMKSVVQRIPEAQLLIVGEGRLEQKLKEQVKSLGLERSILFLPPLEDTRGVLAAMDLFVMPSLKEGLGLALMEAMVSGLAVVASDVGGIRDLVEDGRSGLLVKPADSQALAGAMLELLNDAEKRASFSACAEEFISKNFSKEKMALETEKVYLECLK